MLLDIDSHEPRCNVGRVTVIRYFVRKRCESWGWNCVPPTLRLIARPCLDTTHQGTVCNVLLLYSSLDAKLSTNPKKQCYGFVFTFLFIQPICSHPSNRIREALGVQDLTTVGSVRRSPTYGLRGG